MLIDHINRWADATPEKTALVSNGLSMTYGEFADAIGDTLGRLASAGLPDAGTVFLPGEDRVQSWLHILALRRLGLSPLTLMPWIPTSGLDIGKPDVLLTRSRREFLKARIKNCLSARRVVLLPGEPPQKICRQRPGPRDPRRKYGDMLMLSSGTTGRYKVLVLPGSDFAHTHAAVSRTYRLNQDTVFNFHGIGPWTGMGGRVLPSVWACGGTVIFDTEKNCFSRIFQHGTNTTFFVPTDVQKVVESPPPDGDCLIFLGGGFLSERNAHTLESMPQCNAVFGYGATEASGLLMQKELKTGHDDTEHWLEPLPGRRIEVVDESGRLCEDGIEGTLRLQTVKGDCVGYLGDKVRTSQIYSEGYIYTGDLATRRADGRIRINGRAADVVILRSQKISATEIESTVRSGLGVESACAFSGLGANGEEELVIALELPELPDAAKLVQLKPLLPAFEAVRWVALPSFPRTDTGLHKIRRSALRAMLFPVRSEAASSSSSVQQG